MNKVFASLGERSFLLSQEGEFDTVFGNAINLMLKD